ncbi:MAG TPA: SAM-dependent methyltransferase [Opitutaceae bacterium]|nr:SAM-dependent methyltransferase [Opitutaceae bacterium]
MKPARERFLELLRETVAAGALVKLTLGKHRGPDDSLVNLFARPVSLRGGPHLSLLWRHRTRDVTKNLPPAEALARLEPLIGSDFLHAHLFTRAETAQLECEPGGAARLRRKAAPTAPAAPEGPGDHDRVKRRPLDPSAPWLQALGVTHPDGQPRAGMAPKLRQIERFAELLGGLLREAGLPAGEAPVELVDMGSGKGYLTFAAAALLGDGGRVRGVEARPELAAFCNQVAAGRGWSGRLGFEAGTIAATPLGRLDALVALHACDTATDDALAKGIAAGARLLVVAPCCHKEARPQLAAAPVLGDALRHGILAERQAEFATDALRAQLLEWAGYRTRVFEFVSTEHTAKNLMIAGVRAGPGGDPALAGRIRAFAAFYGIRRQALARQLGFDLGAG